MLANLRITANIIAFVTIIIFYSYVGYKNFKINKDTANSYSEKEISKCFQNKNEFFSNPNCLNKIIDITIEE